MSDASISDTPGKRTSLLAKSKVGDDTKKSDSASDVKIKELSIELKKIEAELKETNKKAKDLRERKKAIKSDIQNYMEATNNPIIKVKGTLYIKQTKIGRSRISKKEKRASMTEFLQSLGVAVTEDKLDQMEESMKGEQIEKLDIKIQEVK